MLSKELHHKIYLLGLVIVLVGLPLSVFLLSVGQLLLSLNWLLEGDFKSKWNRLKANHYALAVFLTIYLVHVMGLWNTSNMDHAFTALRIKLPLLALPLVIGTSSPVSARSFKYIMYLFIVAIFIGTVFSMSVYIDQFHNELFDKRFLSVFISHIRFTLLINLAIFIAGYYLVRKRDHLSRTEKTLLLAMIVWFIIFLGILQTLTGIVVFFVVSYIILTKWSFYNKRIRWTGLVMLILIPIGIILYVHSIAQLLEEPEKGFTQLKSHTINGNPYYHDTTKRFVENNHYIWTHISDVELAKEWNKRSDLDYHGKDLKNQLIKHTIVRYMASKGVTKDSAGLRKLTDKDIQNIEKSMSNYLFDERSGLFKRVYQLLWELDIYQKGGAPSGHSILQRFEYFNIAISVIRENFWFGVGTGDEREALHKAYKASDTRLDQKDWRRAHNQYLTYLLTFGIFGFTWIWLAFFYPFITMKKWNDPLAFIFMVTALLSMIHEDTLGSHTGVTFVAFFYALFIFGQQKGTHALPG